jgi:hypothetical protein
LLLAPTIIGVRYGSMEGREEGRHLFYSVSSRLKIDDYRQLQIKHSEESDFDLTW